MNQLELFYSSRLGKYCYKQIDCQLKFFLPNAKYMNILGIGYSTPWLKKYIAQSENLFVFMPYGNETYNWPPHKKNLTCIIDQDNLPISDLHLDRVFICHTLEHSSNIEELLKEVWRVLKGDGKILILIPNRLGFWARNETTPFGHGRSFSKNQIINLLKSNRFEDIKIKFSLYIPPTNNNLILRYFKRMEGFFVKWLSGFGGVMLVEAKKQVYSAQIVNSIKNKKLSKLISLPAKAMRVTNYQFRNEK